MTVIHNVIIFWNDKVTECIMVHNEMKKNRDVGSLDEYSWTTTKSVKKWYRTNP